MTDTAASHSPERGVQALLDRNPDVRMVTVSVATDDPDHLRTLVRARDWHPGLSVALANFLLADVLRVASDCQCANCMRLHAAVKDSLEALEPILTPRQAVH